MTKRIMAVAIALGVVVITASAQAQVVIDATDRGWYDHTGHHNPANGNYAVGHFGGVTYRNWFVFDLSTIDIEIVALQLRAWNPMGGYTSPDDFETYVNYDVTTDLNDLINGLGGVAAYDDLGSGTVYASHDASNSDNETIVVIDLNAAAVADANAAAGGLWGIGGAITTLIKGGATEVLFGFTGPGTDVQLVVTLIPPKCPWDLDGSGSVGAADLLDLLFNWGPCPGCAADFDGDDIVGASDLLDLLFNWGPCE